MGGLFFICIPQIFKPFAVFLCWVGQEDAVFTVVFCGGGGPVIRARHHTPIIKDCEFIMFNLVPAVGADGYAGGDQFINHGRFMPGHNSIGDDADTVHLQLDLFADTRADERESKLQHALLDIKGKFGKNAVLRGINYHEKSTGRKRNTLVGGHNG